MTVVRWSPVQGPWITRVTTLMTYRCIVEYWPSADLLPTQPAPISQQQSGAEEDEETATSQHRQ